MSQISGNILFIDFSNSFNYILVIAKKIRLHDLVFNL